MKSDPAGPTNARSPLRRALSTVKGLVVSHTRLALSNWAYRGWLPSRHSHWHIKRFWENSAHSIHQEWGRDQTDYAVLATVISRYHVRSVLDAGCGSGRLFELYERCGITRIVGTDISETALCA